MNIVSSQKCKGNGFCIEYEVVALDLDSPFSDIMQRVKRWEYIS